MTAKIKGKKIRRGVNRKEVVERLNVSVRKQMTRGRFPVKRENSHTRSESKPNCILHIQTPNPKWYREVKLWTRNKYLIKKKAMMIIQISN